MRASRSLVHSKLVPSPSPKVEPAPLNTFRHLEQWQLWAPSKGAWMAKVSERALCDAVRGEPVRRLLS